MRILVVGAGVIGSFNAARSKEAGQDVTLLARGRRLADLREHGVVLEDFRTGPRTTTQVPLVERLGPEDDYDLALVVMRRNQIPSVLPMLARSVAMTEAQWLYRTDCAYSRSSSLSGAGFSRRIQSPS